MRANGIALFFLAVCLLLSALAAAQAQPSIIHVSGSGVQTIDVSANDLAHMPRVTVDVKDAHTGEQEHFEGVLISDVLAKAGAPLGEKLRGKGVATYVVAHASDGYAAVYSIAELDPAMTDNRILVADTMNGKPLGPKDGPFRMVAPADKRMARWVRMLTALEVENAVSPSESSPR
jgi:hypothetical protein